MDLANLLGGYVVGKRIHVGRRASVYEATRESDGLAVLCKVYREDTRCALMARREHDTLGICRHPGIVEAIELRLDGERPVLVLRRIAAPTLRTWIANELPTVASVLQVALRLAQLLEVVHEARVVHRDITPQNVLVEPNTLETYLIDFGIALSLGVAAQPTQEPTPKLAGTLSYLAPEQSGWVNHGCDFRSDLYGLGATLYHALTGRPPFLEEKKAIELIHAQLAKPVTPPHELRPEIPVAVSRLILTLLRKDPGDRYQSARALRGDLQKMGAALACDGELRDDFELILDDAPDRPRFSARLYGRDRELERLQAVLAAQSSDRPRCILLRGRAGSGKSALMHALHPMFTALGGRIAAGQFHANAEQPYSGWTSALGSFTSQILLEREREFEAWQERLRRGLGALASALIDIAPDLEHVLRGAPPAPQLGPREARDRLALALERLMQVCDAHQQPMLVLLDDLQWSDAGSRYLLERILTSPDVKTALVICAYREEAVDARHSLSSWLERLTQRGAAPEIIDLSRLDDAAARRMLADALGADDAHVQGLARYVARLTDNTPLLIRELLEDLHVRGLLRLHEGRWTWNLSEIEAASVPDGVVALMTARLDRLPPLAVRALEAASCMTTDFDVRLLARVLDQELPALESALDAVADAGLVIPSAGGFRFVHERIRESAQSRISDDERAHRHARIAVALLESAPPPAQGVALFALADHLNRAGARLPAHLGRTRIELNARAGQSALRGGSGADAASYLEAARAALEPTDWQTQRSFCFDLSLDLAETWMQTSDFARAHTLLDELDARAASKLEIARIAEKRIYLWGLSQPPLESVRYTLDVLRRLGVRWPLHPSWLRTRYALLRVRWKLRGRSVDDLMRRAERSTPDRIAVLLVLNVAGGLMARVDARLSALATALTMEQFLTHGYLGSPSLTLAALALWNYTYLRNDARMRSEAECALRWADRVPDPIFSPRAEFQIHGVLHPWQLSRRRAFSYMRRCARLLTEAGDPEWGYYARFTHGLHRALCGDPIDDVLRELDALVEAVRSLAYGYPDPEQLCLAFRTLQLDPDDSDAIERGAVSYESWVAGHPKSAESMIRTLWMLALCIHRRFDLALAQSDALGERLFYQLPFVHTADHTFYRGFAAAQVARTSRGRARRRALRSLRRARARLRGWARSGVDFRHMYVLLEAEHAALRGRWERALRDYEAAARGAEAQGFVHHAALAEEQRARLLVSRGRADDAVRALGKASSEYLRWGARGKGRALARERSQLLRTLRPRT